MGGEGVRVGWLETCTSLCGSGDKHQPLSKRNPLDRHFIPIEYAYTIIVHERELRKSHLTCNSQNTVAVGGTCVHILSLRARVCVCVCGCVIHSEIRIHQSHFVSAARCGITNENFIAVPCGADVNQPAAGHSPARRNRRPS